MFAKWIPKFATKTHIFARLFNWERTKGMEQGMEGIQRAEVNQRDWLLTHNPPFFASGVEGNWEGKEMALGTVPGAEAGSG